MQWRIQGRGQRGLGPPYFWTLCLIFGPYFCSLCHGLDDRALALSGGLDPPLKSWEVGLKCELVGELELPGVYCSIA